MLLLFQSKNGSFFQTFAEMNIKFPVQQVILKMAKLKKVLVAVAASLQRNKNAAFWKSALFLCSI